MNLMKMSIFRVGNLMNFERKCLGRIRHADGCGSQSKVGGDLSSACRFC